MVGDLRIRWTKKTQRQHDILHEFNNSFGYSYDIWAVNKTHFENYFQDNYPKELKLTKSNNNSIRTIFLDLDITLENGNLHTKSYYQRDDFNFSIAFSILR